MTPLETTSPLGTPRCPVCQSPLSEQRDALWLAGVMPGELMETTPVRPAGAEASTPEWALVCTDTDCRRVYLVWDGIPNLLIQEAGMLTWTGAQAPSPDASTHPL